MNPTADIIFSGNTDEHATMTHFKNVAVLLLLWMHLPARIKG